MRQIIIWIGFLLLLVQCSPSKFFEKGNYKKAYKAAAKELNKDKNIGENTIIMEASANELVTAVLVDNAYYTASDNINYWLKAQNEYYDVLSLIGKYGKDYPLLVSEPYDELCEVKSDIDYKIVAYFYNEGVELLEESVATGEKRIARDAYYTFQKCEKYGGELYYDDIDVMMETCKIYGTVYFQSDGIDISESLFFEETNNMDWVDCYISSHWGTPYLSESVSESTHTYTKKIQTGTVSKVDTAGVTISYPIYEEIEAKVTKTIYTVTGNLDLDIYADDISGQCSYSNNHFDAQYSDSYVELDISGDERAYPSYPGDTYGEPAFFTSRIIDELYDIIDYEIRVHL